MFDKIKFARVLKKINDAYESQREFAKKSEINRTYLSQYMNMKLNDPPKPKILVKLSNASKGIVSYNELMLICGYIGDPGTAIYDFSSENDKRIIDEAISYSVSNNISSSIINSNYYIKDLLRGLDSMTASRALEQIKLEIMKGESMYGINTYLDQPSYNSAIVFVYGTIPAGVPMEMIEDIIDTEEISADMLKGGKQYFGLKIKGDSMYPEYRDGDVIICEKVEDCENGDECIVMVNGNDGTFKKVLKNENGIILQPLNPEFEPMIYSNEQIERLPVKIIGRVVEMRRKK